MKRPTTVVGLAFLLVKQRSAYLLAAGIGFGSMAAIATLAPGQSETRETERSVFESEDREGPTEAPVSRRAILRADRER